MADELDFNDIAPAAGADSELDELAEFMERQRRQAAGGTQAAPAAQITSHPTVGNFVHPTQNTWAAHRQLVLNPALHLYFNPQHYGLFDFVIHQNTSHAPVWDHTHRRYHSYDVLRENLAIIRNYILCEYFTDGSVDNTLTDRRKAKHLRQIAQFLSEGFNNDRWLRNPFKPRISIAKANIPGTGAQYLYQQILRREHYNSWLAPVSYMVSFLFSDADKLWNLPALADSPFSDEKLRLAPPSDKPDNAVSDAELLEVMEMMDREERDAMSANTAQEQGADTHHSLKELNSISEEFVQASSLMVSVQELQEPTRREAIDIAKDILEKLKIKIGKAFVSHGLSPFDGEALAMLDALKSAVKVYTFHLHKLAGLDGAIYENPAVKAANEAIGKLSYVAKAETLFAARKMGDKGMIALIEADLMGLPVQWTPGEHETFDHLFGDINSGLDAVLLRLNQISKQDPTADYWLGFSEAKGLGGQAPTAGNMTKGTNPEKAIADDKYFQQLQAQRVMRARQAAVRYSANQNRVRQNNHDDHHHHHFDRPQSASSINISSLLGDDALNAMRNAMKTSGTAEAVQTGTKANAQQIIQQKEQAMRAQRQRVALEQVRRSNKRLDDTTEINHPPPGRKKDHGGHHM